ncbi:MAG: glutamate racemase [Bacteroidetes bacterium]|uniref:Glutamate racemase n=1 Tax=Candidatus Cryptobacteroides merdavium TaxID=2840769 RepID=A0A9D9HAJ5_9BACT|nr:glutamate racemase [Candidatus Cryptobacteroides merdavium]
MATIGIFDSGAGGLSVFREIYRMLPEESYIYWSDNAYCPYGKKPQELIIERSRHITDFLLSQGTDIIVVACNTATAAAISALRAGYSCKEDPVVAEHVLKLTSGRRDHVLFIGMEPAVKPAALQTRSGVVGVLATAGTLSGMKYHRTRDSFASGVRVVEHVGEGFVELVESGKTSGPEAEAVVRTSLQPLLDAGADVIVLGCTHYPFLMDVIRKIAGPSVAVIDPAPAVARHLLDVMSSDSILPSSSGNVSETLSENLTGSLSETMSVTSSAPAPNIRLFASGPIDPLLRLFSKVYNDKQG